jgi:hypothetical protein
MRLANASHSVAQAEQDLLEDWESGNPTTYFKKYRFPFPVEEEELRNLYSRVLRDGGERETYDLILALPNQKICPQCGVGRARTLDHYFPRSRFPELAVVPINLVPVCGDCNFEKLDLNPTSISECVFNPYFDDWKQFKLVEASVVYGAGVLVKYNVVQPNGCPEVIYNRAKAHFEGFNLADNFSVAAAGALTEVRTSCATAAELSGSQGVQVWLDNQAKERTNEDPNSWRSAMYRAMAQDARFISGGYLEIL